MPIPALVIALFLGVWLHPWLKGPRFASGLRFCVSRILRIGVALLGVKVALGYIAALGINGRDDRHHRDSADNSFWFVVCEGLGPLTQFWRLCWRRHGSLCRLGYPCYVKCLACL